MSDEDDIERYSRRAVQRERLLGYISAARCRRAAPDGMQRKRGVWRPTEPFLSLVRAALTLGQPFDLEELVMAAWRLRPDLWSLGSEPHPDSRRVHCLVYSGHRGLIGRGVFTKVGAARFRVNEKCPLVVQERKAK